MSILFTAYRELLNLEYPLHRRNFSAIYERVRQTPVRTPQTMFAPEQLRHAVDLAAALYFRKVLCLQRSAATVRLLKQHGFAAQLVIGVQQLPFAAHAWVELDGVVFNDKPYMSEIYSVLERC
ncbi:MAG: lasso peptide biosynthesis B2 protein [Acidobacteria bacterium]|nr:lasso peptide biosynthesis B2 protein [Acidobacteriota bacterium]